MNKMLKITLVMAIVFSFILMPVTFAASNKLIGDVNKDGVVNSNDAMLVMQFAEGKLKKIDKKLADVDSDRKVTKRDAQIILARYVELIDALPHKCEFKNRTCVCGLESKLGDVNEDGKVNSVDSMIVLQFVTKEVKKIDKKLADVDLDKKVTQRDAQIILAYYVRAIDTLPHTCKFVDMKCTCGIEIKLGDVNDDGKINNLDANQVLKFVKNSKVKINKEMADVDTDGRITQRDAQIILAYYVELISELPHTCELVDKKCVCGLESKLGDVNEDGKVNNADATKVLQFVKNKMKKVNLELADVNVDGKVTKEDAQIILAYYVGNINKLPHTCRFANGRCACGNERVNELHDVKNPNTLKSK